MPRPDIWHGVALCWAVAATIVAIRRQPASLVVPAATAESLYLELAPGRLLMETPPPPDCGSSWSNATALQYLQNYQDLRRAFCIDENALTSCDLSGLTEGRLPRSPTNAAALPVVKGSSRSQLGLPTNQTPTKDVPIYGGEINPWVTVHHDLLPPQSLHQECATAQWGSKLILAGGINGSLGMPADQVVASTIGGQVTTVYDMASMRVTFGPLLPWRGNHNIGAITSSGMFHVTGGFRQDAPKGEPLAYSLHAAWDVRSGLATSTTTGTWKILAPMLHPRGAHACEFLGDGRMYCVGGGPDRTRPRHERCLLERARLLGARRPQ